MEDNQVITLVRNGNIDVFAVVIERYQSPIAGYLYRLTGDYEAAKDLTQDTFIQAFKSIRKNDHDIQLKSWLYGVATNVALRYRRHKRVLTFIPFEDYLRVDSTDDNSEQDSIGEKIVVEETLLKIPEEQRICMVLHYVEGFKYREIAQTLGVTEDAVRMRVARGSREFRRLHGPAGGVDG